MLKTLFVINPISGLGKQKDLPELIDLHLDKSRFDFNLCITEYAGHAKIIAREAKKKYDLLVAVGGDGTINEVASSLLQQEAAMGIIPFGSGNGLARHLQISTNPVKALIQLNRSRMISIDAGMLNRKPFFNVSGTGFDAQISKSFANKERRGYITYARCVLEEIKHYVPKKYALRIHEKIIEDTFFLIAFANTAQYGNNVFIAPQAQINDGLLDVVMVRPFPAIYFPTFAALGLSGNLYHSPYVQVLRAKEITLHNLEKAPIHLDGEYEGKEEVIQLSVKEQEIRIMVPQNFQNKNPGL